MKSLAFILALALTIPAFADAIEEVRQSEIAFAKAFADRDKAKFFSFVADDAVFMNALGTLRGKAEVVKGWSRFFDNVPVAPFSWGPERVEIMAGGKVGFSMGPIYDGKAQHGGYYTSVWQKQADGSWKIILDGPGSPPAPLPQTAAKLDEGDVTTPDGVKLHYRRLRGGPITIIAPLDFVFHEPFSQFADVATVITYDPRNRGRSTRAADESTWTIEQDVRDLETLRDALKVEKFVAIGWSYFGKMVTNYAAAHPERVSRIVQLGPGANDYAKAGKPDTSPAGAPEGIKPADASPREACLAFWKVFGYAMVGDPKHASRFDPAIYCATENEQQFRRTFDKLWPTIQASVLSPDELKKVTMPVLVIHGTKDRNAAYADGRAWAATLPDARLITIPNAAHAMWLDDPVTTFGAIRHFLRSEWPLDSARVTTP